MEKNEFIEKHDTEDTVLLDENVMTDPSVGQKMYEYYRDVRGFDAAVHSGWQHNYGDMIVSLYKEHLFDKSGKALRVLDIGCAMGSNTKALKDRGCDVVGIDINRYFIDNSPFKDELELHCNAAWDMKDIPDNSIDFIHSQQVFEHIPAEKIDDMFSEIVRVCKNKFVLFSALVMGDPPKGKAKGDDTTHVGIQPRKFWIDKLKKFKIKNSTTSWQKRFNEESMYQEYNWALLCGYK